MRNPLALLTVAALCIACNQSAVAEPEYRLTTLNGTPFTATATLVFGADGTLSGQAPCNRWFARQTATLPSFAIEGIGATKMACPDLDAESRYLNALQAADTATKDDTSLRLTGPDGVVMEFTTP